MEAWHFTEFPYPHFPADEPQSRINLPSKHFDPAIGARLYDRRIGFWAAIAYVSLPGASVAAYVISMDRPQKADLDKDFPIRTQKPADAGYGPYVDGFGQDQHRFGPFQPIHDRLKAMKQTLSAGSNEATSQ